MVREALRDCARRPGFWFWTLAQVGAAALCSACAISARPGYESALVLAPVASLGSGMIAAGTVVRLRRLGSPVRFGKLLGRVLAAVAPGTLASLAMLVAAACVRGFCDPWQGLGFFACGPLCSALASAGLSTAIALSLPGFRYPFAGWIAALVASLAWDAALIYFTPQVFVYDHLLGTFAGPLYDEAVGLTATHLVFRLVTAARLAGLLLAAWALHDPDALRLRSSRLEGRLARGVLAALVVVVLSTFLAEPALGLRSSQARIRRTLGATSTTRHFIIHHPSELTERQVEFLEAEVEVGWAQLEEFFAGAPERRMVINVFRTASEMRRLTGTGPTNVAKPWLGATFIVYEPPPHPVLKHEMAHLFSARWGRGPFRTPGAILGILADPLILEGTAVAADWKGDPLDPHMRSAAILEAGLIEDPASLVGLVGFYSHQGGLAYVMSGSFVRFLWESHGPEAIRSWYSGAGFEEAFGTSRSRALDAWQERIRATKVPPGWIDALERRYSGKSVFARPCPHQVARLVGEAARARVAGERERSGAILDRACSIAEGDTGLAVLRLRHLVSSGRLATARSRINDLLSISSSLGGHHTAVLELSGDVSWLEGRERDARRSYSQALGLSAEDATVRMLSVKLWAVRNPGPGMRIRDFLLGADGGSGTRFEILEPVVEAYPDEPVLRYLLGRAYAHEGRWSKASENLEKALEGSLETAVIKGEAMRLLAASLLWSGDRRGSLRILGSLEKMPPPTPSLRYHASEWKALAEAMK